MEDKQTLLDTHFHIWELDRFKYKWPTSDQGPLFCDIGIDKYKAQLAPTPIKHGIFVQVASDYAVEEAEWLLSLAEKHESIAGIVAGFKLDDPNLENILKKFCAEKLFVGIRHIQEFETDGWLLTEDCQRGFAMLAERKIPYSLLINSLNTRDCLLQLVKNFPEHPCIVDHMGKPITGPNIQDGWDEWITELSKYPNVHCKLSSQFFPANGPLTAAQKAGHFSDTDCKYVNRCLELFGVDRCIFGSDWPVCQLSGISSFAEFYDMSRAMLGHLTEKEQDKIFGGNAIKLYNIEIN